MTLQETVKSPRNPKPSIRDGQVLSMQVASSPHFY